MALIELATVFRVLAEHLERDAGSAAATTIMALFPLSGGIHRQSLDLDHQPRVRQHGAAAQDGAMTRSSDVARSIRAALAPQPLAFTLVRKRLRPEESGIGGELTSLGFRQ
jgi:hypothetical protein